MQAYNCNPSLVWFIWFWQLDKGMRGWQGKREVNGKTEIMEGSPVMMWGVKWWLKSNKASVVRIGEQSRLQMNSTEQRDIQFSRVCVHAFVCARLIACKKEGVCVGLISGTGPKAVWTCHFPQTHFLISRDAHTKADHPNPDGVIHIKGSMKGGACLPFCSLWVAPEWVLNMSHSD